jgi:predicted Zn finger-like uncharacterized protein
MQITLRCPECETEFRIDRSEIARGGFEAKCWWCSTTIAVDGPPAEVMAEPVAGPSNPPRPETAAPIGQPPSVNRQMVPTPSDREELLEMMLTSERERREMAWEMTRELFRIRESVERQQMVVAKLVDTVFNKNAAPSLHDELFFNYPPAQTPAAENNHTPPAEPVESEETAARREALSAKHAEMEGQLDQLQTALETEKQVIDRLRRGKLELERRAAEAESTLKALRHRGFLDRLLGREAH